MIMKKRTKIILLIPGILIVFGVLVIFVFGINILVHQYQKYQRNQTIEEEPMPENLNSFLILERIQGDFDFQGRVKEISGSDLIIRGFNIETEEPLFLVVPVSQETEIISLHILTEGAAEEEIAGSVTTLEGKEYNIGEKQVGFDKIELEDNLCIFLKVKPDHTIEEMVAWASPADLIEDLK